MTEPNDIEKPLAEWILGPKNQHLVVLWPNGDVLLYEWVRGRFGRCLAAYRWTGAKLHNVIGGVDTGTETRLFRDIRERWKAPA